MAKTHALMRMRTFDVIKGGCTAEVPFSIMPLPFLGRLLPCTGPSVAALTEVHASPSMCLCHRSAAGKCSRGGQVANFAGSQFNACRIQWSGPFAHEDSPDTGLAA